MKSYSRRNIAGAAIFIAGIVLFFATPLFPWSLKEPVIYVSWMTMFVGNLIARREFHVGDLD